MVRGALRLLWLGLLAAVLGFVGALALQWLLVPQSPSPPPETVSRPRLLQPDDPGFAEHLAQGCPGDVDWSPCVLQLPPRPLTDGFEIPRRDGGVDLCLPTPGEPETMTCTEKKKS